MHKLGVKFNRDIRKMRRNSNMNFKKLPSLFCMLLLTASCTKNGNLNPSSTNNNNNSNGGCDLVVTAKSNSPVNTGDAIELDGGASTTSYVKSVHWDGPNGFTSKDYNPTIPIAGLNDSGTYTFTAESWECSKKATVKVSVKRVDPPCTIPDNTAQYQGQTSVSLIAGGKQESYDWEISASGMWCDLYLKFNGTNPPTPGIYKIHELDYLNPRARYVQVSTVSGYPMSFLFNSGEGNVYVDVGNGKITASFCDLQFVEGTQAPSFKGSAKVTVQ